MDAPPEAEVLAAAEASDPPTVPLLFSAVDVFEEGRVSEAVFQAIVAKCADDVKAAAFNYALGCGRVAAVEALLRSGVDVNAPATHGQYPLGQAVTGRVHMEEAVFMTTKDGAPPSPAHDEMACRLTEMLLRAGARTDYPPMFPHQTTNGAAATARRMRRLGVAQMFDDAAAAEQQKCIA